MNSHTKYTYDKEKLTWNF